MKRIGIVSDSHGFRGQLQQALIKLEADGRIDALIHCGDGCNDASALAGNILHTVIVRGNCDSWMDPFEEEQLVSIGGVTIFITHGHRYGVKSGLDVLADTAAAKGAQVACFGHTHRAVCEYKNGVLLINPASCAVHGTCALLTIDNSGSYSARLL